MALSDRIQNDMKAALLSGDRFKGDVLRGLKAAILNEEVAQNRRDNGLSDTEIEQIVAKEVKKRAESIKLFEENGRPELAQTEKDEIAVLKGYLPEQISEADLTEIVQKVIADMGANQANMGQVIGAVKMKVGNTADGRIIAEIVKRELIQ